MRVREVQLKLRVLVFSMYATPSPTPNHPLATPHKANYHSASFLNHVWREHSTHSHALHTLSTLTRQLDCLTGKKSLALLMSSSKSAISAARDGYSENFKRCCTDNTEGMEEEAVLSLVNHTPSHNTKQNTH